MGKYLTLTAGLAAMGFGVWATWVTWPLFWIALTAMVPALFVVGGLLAVLVGLGEIGDSLARRKDNPHPGANPETPKP